MMQLSFKMRFYLLLGPKGSPLKIPMDRAMYPQESPRAPTSCSKGPFSHGAIPAGDREPMERLSQACRKRPLLCFWGNPNFSKIDLGMASISKMDLKGKRRRQLFSGYQ